MTKIQHDPRCDEHHTPRQRCNRHMTPAAARIARLASEAAAERPQNVAPKGEPDAGAGVEADPVPDEIATVTPPEATGPVSREWNAVAVVFSRPAQGIMAAALGFGLLLVVMRRMRT